MPSLPSRAEDWVGLDHCVSPGNGWISLAWEEKGNQQSCCSLPPAVCEHIQPLGQSPTWLDGAGSLPDVQGSLHSFLQLCICKYLEENSHKCLRCLFFFFFFSFDISFPSYNHLVTPGKKKN